MQIELELKGLEKARRALSGATLAKVTERALQRFADELKMRAVPYPPEGPYNRPGGPGSRWYQRHFGQRWMRQDGTIGGINTSERMQKQWVVQMRGPWSAFLRNKASYSSYVMGEDQTRVHKGHGWSRVDELAIKHADIWYRAFEEELAKEMR